MIYSINNAPFVLLDVVSMNLPLLYVVLVSQGENLVSVKERIIDENVAFLERSNFLYVVGFGIELVAIRSIIHIHSASSEHYQLPLIHLYPVAHFCGGPVVRALQLDFPPHVHLHTVFLNAFGHRALIVAATSK